MTEPVTIVGGGLAGSLLATHLGRLGHRVTVFDSRPDPRLVSLDSGRSINLALARRGIEALHELGLMDRVETWLTAMSGRMVHDTDGSVEFHPYGSRPHEVIFSVSRHDLNRILVEAAAETDRVDFRFGQRCIGGDIPGRSLRFRASDDGSEYDVEASTIFGADGVRSVVRSLMVEAGSTSVTVEPLDHGYKELNLPSASDGAPLIARNALHIWPRGGFMLIALVNIDDSFTCTVFLPEEGEGFTLSDLSTPQDVRARFEEHFPDFAELVPDLEGQFLGNRAGHLETIRCSGWSYQDRAVLVGDAAHGIVPFHGQGMNAAFESVSVLVGLLRSHPQDWAAAFSEFERIRKPDTDAIAEMAIDNYVEMRSTVRDDRFVLKREVAHELERRWPDRFVPRYSMVMFNTIPYAEAQRRAADQAHLLDELVGEATTIDEVDLERAEALVAALEDRRLIEGQER